MAYFTPELLNKLKYGYYFWPILIISGLIVSIINYFIDLWRTVKYLKWIDGPRCAPLLGNAMNFLGKSNTEHFMLVTEWLEKYDGLVQTWIFHRPTVFISRKELVEKLLKGIADTLMTKGDSYIFLSDAIGKGIFTEHAIEWNKRRKYFNGFFLESNLARIVQRISHHGRALVNHLEDKAKKSHVIDIQLYAKLSSLDVITDILMDCPQNYLSSKNMSYADALKTTTEVVMKRTYTALYNWSLIYVFTFTRSLQTKASKSISNFTDKVLLKWRKARESEKQNGDKNENGNNSLLEYILEKPKIGSDEIDEEFVRREINNFSITGIEPLSSAVAFTLYLIGHHPDIQGKVYEEIRSTLPNLRSESGPSISEINKLNFLGKCIKESLRLYPAVPWILRKLRNTIKIDNDKVLPEGTSIAISVYSLHREQKYYTNPEQFDPDRFQSGNFDEIENYTYLPFGVGWRNCIGQKLAIIEMKIILSHIINEYSVISLNKPEELEITGNMILRSANGLKVKLSIRSKK